MPATTTSRVVTPPSRWRTTSRRSSGRESHNDVTFIEQSGLLPERAHEGWTAAHAAQGPPRGAPQIIEFLTHLLRHVAARGWCSGTGSRAIAVTPSRLTRATLYNRGRLYIDTLSGI